MNEEFYYKLLNIGYQNRDINQIILNSINEVVKEIKTTNQNLDRMCKVVANNIGIKLKDNKIDYRIVNLADYNLYEHVVILCRTMVNDKLQYYLIDPSFIQFKNTKLFNDLKLRNETIFNSLTSIGYAIVSELELYDYFKTFGYNKEMLNLNEIFLEFRYKTK